MQVEKFWQERFTKFALRYDEDHLIAGWSKEGLKRRLKTYLNILKKMNLPKEVLILDLGCGAGTYCRALKKSGYHNIIGLDYSFAVLRKTQEKTRSVPLINANIYNLPFKNQIFDHIICIGVFQAITNEKTALLEIKRILKKGGILTIGILNAAEIYYLIRKTIKPDPNMQNLRRYYIHYFKKIMTQTGFHHLQSEGVFIFPERLNFLYKISLLTSLPFCFAHSVFITARLL